MNSNPHVTPPEAPAAPEAPEAPAAATTMRAVVQHEYGSADTLRVAERAIPQPGPSDVLVRVSAAGVDSGTWHLMHGRPLLARLAFGLRRPKNPVPGLDLAGVVVAVGARVTRFAVGDEVFGIGRGSFAEYSVAPERKLAHRPEGLSATDAAAVPVSGLTALQALRDAAQVQSGARVLVIGASGGVGTYAVQIAIAYGAEVTGVCSAAKAEFVRSLGAAEVIDRSQPEWCRTLIERDTPFDAVIDIAGRLPVRDLRRLTTRRGALVFVGGEGGGPITGGMGRQLRGVLRGLVSRQRVTLLVSKVRGVDVEHLGQLIVAGQVTPRIDRVFALDGSADALWAIERGEVRGKLVVRI